MQKAELRIKNRGVCLTVNLLQINPVAGCSDHVADFVAGLPVEAQRCSECSGLAEIMRFQLICVLCPRFPHLLGAGKFLDSGYSQGMKIPVRVSSPNDRRVH